MSVQYVKSIYDNNKQRVLTQADIEQEADNCFACFHYNVNAGNNLFNRKRFTITILY